MPSDPQKPGQTPTPPKKPDDEKNSKLDLVNKEWAATIIFSGAVLLLVTFLIIRHDLFTGLLAYVLDVLRPITIGLVIAFVLYRPASQIERLCSRVQKRLPRFPVAGVSVLLSYLLLLLLLVVIIWIIVPQFIDSIRDFTDNILVYYVNLMRFLNSERGAQVLQILNENGFDPASLRERLMNFTDYIPVAIETLSAWTSGLIGGVIDFFIGLIFSVYVLAGRHKLHAQGRQILRHYLPQKHYRRLSHYGRLTFSTFSNFVSGQLSDAFILGLLIFIVMTIGGLEYPMMIAVILGITNMIPYVGPWLGTIPCALILLMVNPWHAVAFVIIVIIAQQVDSNLIYPKVVGSSVGLPAIWVLFAITVGGGLFGVGGMIMGVPVMSIIYTIIKEKTSPDVPGSNANAQSQRPRRQLHPIRYIRQRFRAKK